MRNPYKVGDIVVCENASDRTEVVGKVSDVKADIIFIEHGHLHYWRFRPASPAEEKAYHERNKPKEEPKELADGLFDYGTGDPWDQDQGVELIRLADRIEAEFKKLSERLDKLEGARSE